ncbi:MAG: Hsp70 family protein, partial [Pirellulaceae bacterium]
LTVPASFDMVARELTVEAARQADVPEDFILLEEPQAASYQWIQAVGDQWRSMMEPGQRILVCDCGGGTTDLTMLVVDQQQGELSLRRMAVGNHLLVGGDNMDVTMAHWAAEKFAAQGVKLNAWQAVS